MTILTGFLVAIGVQAGVLFFAGGASYLIDSPSSKNLRTPIPIPTPPIKPLGLPSKSFALNTPETQASTHNVFVVREANPSRMPVSDTPKQPIPKKLQGEPEETQQASEGSLNMLVLGIDRRPDSEVEGTGTRSDTMMVVRIEPDTGKVRLLSIPRDLLVEIAPGWQDRINAAYAYYGAEGARTAVENLTGIPIDNHTVVDFEGFRSVVDAMGGVKVDVKGEFPPQWNIEEGVQKLDGRKALFYARYRGTGGDLDRIERQQRLADALRTQAFRWNSVTKLPEVVRMVNENVETDIGMGEMISLGRALIKSGRNGHMTAVQLKGYPATMPNGNQVLMPDRQTNEAILEKFR